MASSELSNVSTILCINLTKDIYSQHIAPVVLKF